MRRVYLFEDLSTEALGKVLDGMKELDFETDQWIFFRDDEAKRFFLVLEGDVALVRHSPNGDEMIVAIVGASELFEEDLLLVEDARHSVSARFLGPGRLASFDRARIRGLVEFEPRMIRRLAETMHRRNALLLDELERVTVQDAGERLVSFLESRRTESGSGISLRFPKRVLAARLSIRPETLSRVLARLKSCDRIQELDGSLVLVPEEAPCRTCDACPVQLWGCPGPDRPRQSLRTRSA